MHSLDVESACKRTSDKYNLQMSPNFSVNSLIRCVNVDPTAFRPYKIIVMGSGVTVNGDSPLRESLIDAQLIEHPSGSYNGLSNESIVHGIANSYFQFRTFRDEFIDLLVKRGPFDLKGLMNCIDLINGFVRLRETLALKYSGALKDRSILFREDYNNFLESQNWNETGLITSNWDEILWLNPTVKNIVQIHGRAEIADSLIFPTEYVFDERYLEKILANNLNPEISAMQKFLTANKRPDIKVKDLLQKIVRRKLTQRALKKAHLVAINWLDQASEITFIGSALNVYDAEINSILTARKHSVPFSKVTNINLNPEINAIVGAITFTDPRTIITKL